MNVKICATHSGVTVGEDGATHQGVFDIAFLNPIPNLRILSPKNAVELRNTLYTLQLNNENPTVVRYPKGRSNQVNWKLPFEKIEFNHIEELKVGKEIAIFTTGTIYSTILNVIEKLPNKEMFSLYHFIQIKQFNEEFVLDAITKYKEIIIIEEASIIGSFGSLISQFVATNSGQVKVTCLGVPDQYIDHATVIEQHEICGISENKLFEFFSKC